MIDTSVIATLPTAVQAVAVVGALPVTAARPVRSSVTVTVKSGLAAPYVFTCPPAVTVLPFGLLVNVPPTIELS